ncbi:hypothetical protein ACP70R_030752 [Stipagrostis hirtigluma subsp. patula]
MATAKLGSPEPARTRFGCAQGHRHRLTIVVPIICVVLVVAIAVPVTVYAVGRSRRTPGDRPASGDTTPSKTIARTCRVTLYPELCVSELKTFPGAAGAGDVELVPMWLNATRRRVADALSNVTALAGARAAVAYDDCVELLDVAGDLLDRSVGVFTAPPLPESSIDTAAAADTDAGADEEDVMSWLSAALTYHETCHDRLQQVGAGAGAGVPQLLDRLTSLREHLSNSLALFNALGTTPDGGISGLPIRNQLHRRLLASDDGINADDVSFPPRWVNHGDRRLLQAAAADIVPDMVVAQDGSGTYRNISAAIEAAPDNSHRRFVIHVKAGEYIENVIVGKSKTNIMLVGDGAGKTVVAGNRSVDDNMKTFATATFAVLGGRFIMRDMTVENRAGPERHQAVALLLSADHVVVYRCAVLGYQDTLYVHAQRQFLRDCDVAGTVDFVFGNAAAVLQNCTLWARRGLPKQKNTVTAQGRTDRKQRTGISVHGCRLLPTAELAAAQRDFPTFLGRPWKPFSRVVYMESFMAGHVAAAGWLAWDESGRVPDTIYYGEYQNEGPGAAVAGRVAWPGYRVIRQAAEAMEFTAGKFIHGWKWLPATGVTFAAGLKL